MSWAPIRYRDFYDVPRMFVVSLKGVSYLFDCRFDDGIDDYPDSYQVYELPSEAAGGWPSVADPGLQRIGSVKVGLVTFDPTRSQAIHDSVLTNVAK